jgi:hypothetical protein
MLVVTVIRKGIRGLVHTDNFDRPFGQGGCGIDPKVSLHFQGACRLGLPRLGLALGFLTEDGKHRVVHGIGCRGRSSSHRRSRYGASRVGNCRWLIVVICRVRAGQDWLGFGLGLTCSRLFSGRNRIGRLGGGFRRGDRLGFSFNDLLYDRLWDRV